MPKPYHNATIGPVAGSSHFTRNINAHLLIEEGIRGGVAMITRRFAEANNENVESFDPNKNLPCSAGIPY